MIDQATFKKLSIVTVLVILAILSIIIIKPILSAIVTGLLMAYVFYPVYSRIAKLVRNETLAGILSVLLVIVIILLPIILLLPVVINQIFDFWLYAQNFNISSLINKLLPTFADSNLASDISTSLNTFLSGTVSRALSSVSALFLNLPDFLLKLTLVFFVFFFGMRDGKIFSNYLMSLSPFSKTTEKELTQKFKDITSSVIKGHFLVGALQGLLTGIGLFIFGVPHVLLLTVIAIFASVLPIVGAWLVWIPAAAWLILEGHTALGVGLALYGAIFVSWIDNVIRPYIISKKTKVSSALILIGSSLKRTKANTGAPRRSGPKLGKAWAYLPPSIAARATNSTEVTAPCPPLP